MEKQPADGIVVLCDLRGTVQEIIRNGLQLQGLEAGASLAQLMDAGSRSKWMDFMLELRDKGATVDWEMAIVGGGQMMNVHWAGVMNGENLVIVGTRAARGARNLAQARSEFTHETTGTRRSDDVEQIQTGLDAGVQADSLYDEITRLNNDLVTHQREMAKKNRELERLNAEVERLSVTDALTGVYNRRGVIVIGERELARAQRSGEFMSALLFDLDHFKAINDTYGHDAGDTVLSVTAARCRTQLRKIDVLGRYGGEEFVVLLPGAGLAEAVATAERLRRCVSPPIEVGQENLVVTISVGVSTVSARTASVQALVQQADVALYRAKESGRNRVCVTDESTSAVV